MIALDVQHSASGDTITFPDGKTYLDADVVLKEEDVERLRIGRLCIVCFEPQPEAFPEVCNAPWCDFPIRARQPEVFQKRFREGTVKLGSQVNLEEEAERLGEYDEYESRTGIIVPDHIKFPQGRRS